MKRNKKEVKRKLFVGLIVLILIVVGLIFYVKINGINGNVISSKKITDDSKCIINKVEIPTIKSFDLIGDVQNDFIDITDLSVSQVSNDYLQLMFKVKNQNVPFLGNQGPQFMWNIDSINSHEGYDYEIRINDISGSGIRESWHVWLNNFNENGRSIAHYPAVKINETFIVLLPINLIQIDTKTLKFSLSSGYNDEFDNTNEISFYLIPKRYPKIIVSSSDQKILHNGAYFNDLFTGGKISFKTNIISPSNSNVIFYSSYEKRLKPVSKSTFIGNQIGISMIYGWVNNCYLIPYPLAVSNGNYLYQGNRTAMVFNQPYPDYIKGVYYLDILNSIERDLVEFNPHSGQFIIVDERDSNVLASPENLVPIPIPLYTLPTLENVWFYYGHEYGHHFQGNMLIFNQLLKDHYTESIPSEIAYYSMNKMITLDILPRDIKQMIENDLNSKKNDFLNDLSSYENEGSPFENLLIWPPSTYDPNNVFNGMIIRIEENYGTETIENFFKLFKQDFNQLPAEIILDIQPQDENQVHTMWIVLWSLAAKQDLRNFFSQWNYPIDNEYFNKVYSILKHELI